MVTRERLRKLILESKVGSGSQARDLYLENEGGGEGEEERRGGAEGEEGKKGRVGTGRRGG